MISPGQTAETIGGVHTDIVLQCFADRILILITQLGKVGNLLQATIPPTSPLLPPPPLDPAQPNAPRLPPPPPSIQLTPLLGAPPSEHLRTLYSLYASQAATLVWTAEANEAMGEVPRRGVIVGVALKRRPEGSEVSGAALSDGERDTFLDIMAHLDGLLKRA